MGSLTALNTFGANTLTYTDNRPSGIKFTFPKSRDIATVLGYDLTFDVQKTIDIEEIIKPTLANVYYEIDVSEVSGATVTWSTIPSGLLVTNPSTGVYRISTITTVAQWNTVSTPQIDLPAGYVGSMQYTASIKYYTDTGLQSMSWTVGKTIPVADMRGVFSTSVDGAAIRGAVFDQLVAYDISCEPNELIIDLLEAGTLSEFDYIPGNADAFGNAAPQLNTFSSDAITYSVTLSMDETDILESFSYSGTPDVSFAYDSGTKTATFSGNRSDVNTALSTIVINIDDDPTAFYWRFIITVQVTNDYNDFVDTFTVNAVATDDTYLGVTTSDTYSTNTATTIQGGPEVDPSSLTTGNFTTVITPKDPTQVTSFTGESLLSRSSSGGTPIDSPDTSIVPWETPQISQNGDYILIPNSQGVWLYYRSSGTKTLQKHFDVEGNNGTGEEYDGLQMTYNFNTFSQRWYPVALADNGSYVAIGLDEISGTDYYVRIYVRSGTSWSQQQELGPFTDNIINCKFNQDASKIVIVTDGGTIYNYSRSGSTWSSNYNISNIFTLTLSGTDGGTPWSYTLTYDETYTRKMAFNTTSSTDRLCIGMVYDSISPAITPSDPGWNDVSAYLGEKLYRIFRDSTNERNIIVDQPSGNRSQQVTSCDFNSDASKLVAIGAPTTYSYPSYGDACVVYNRSSTSWTGAHTLPVGAGVRDIAIADSKTDQVIVTLEQETFSSGGGEALDQIQMRYFMAVGSSFVQQFSEEPITGINNASSAGFPGIDISGDGEYIGFVNPSYDVNSDGAGFGRFFEYTKIDNGRFETGTKELTIRNVNKTDTDTLMDDWTMTPATDVSDTIQIVYTVTDPNGVTTSRIQDVDNT